MQPCRILVLEDDLDMRETLEELLQEEGHYVVAVARGEDAVMRASQESFDIIVSDIRMDGMDGLEAIDRARRLQPALGSLVVSGYASEEETLRAFRLNVGGYLRKPFSRSDFLTSVRTILERQTEQLSHRRELECYRNAFSWALQSLVEMGDEFGFPRPQGGLAQIVALCHQLGVELEVAPVSLQQIVWNLQLTGLMGTSAHRSAATFQNWLGQGAAQNAMLQEVLGLARQANVAGRILSLGHWLGLHWQTGEPWPAPPAELDEEIRSIYLRCIAAPAGESEGQLGFLRMQAQDPAKGMLALAETLYDSHDFPAAWQAYKEAYELTAGQPRATSLRACLGLVRLAQRQNHAAAVEEWVERLRVLKLRPSLMGQAWCDLGILLQQPEHLHNGLQLLRDSGLEAIQARARLALHRLGQSLPAEQLVGDAELLLQPVAQPELTQHWSWLLPELLSLAAASKTLHSRIWDYAPELAGLIQSKRLEGAALQKLLLTLETHSGQPPTELMEGLLGHSQQSVRQRASALQQRRESSGEVASLRLQSFGFFQVHCGAHKLSESAWRTQKVKHLLAYLASAWKRRISEDELLDLFWPESKGSSKRSLYVATTELRRVLGNPDYVMRERGCLWLNLELPIWHDASECEVDLAEAAAATQPEAAAVAYRRSCGHVQGSFLEGYYAEWAVRRRGYWEERLRSAALYLSRYALERSEFGQALEWSERALQLDPTCLDAHLGRLKAHLGLRQPEAVIRHYDAAEKLLRREYEMEPSLAMIEVVQRARYGIYE